MSTLTDRKAGHPRRRAVILAAAFVACVAGLAHAGPVPPLLASDGTRPDPSAPLVRVRDSASGRSLPAQAELQSLARADAVRQGALPSSGARLAQVAHGAYQLSVSAPGYHPLSMPLQVDGTAALPVTLWLQPRRPSVEAERRALRAVECGVCAIVSGHVYDRDSGRPLPGLRIRSERGGSATTDRDGAFELVLHASPHTTTDAEALPETTSLVIEGGGYRQALRNLALYQDSHDLILDLAPGGSPPADFGHVQLQAGTAPARATLAGAPIVAAIEAERVATDRHQALDPDDPHAVAMARELAAQAATLPVPGSIRVGTNCSGRSCTGVSVYALEDYVGRGLDDEWIASWRAASLAAGAIAYRSYGAYHVANPVNSQYDICSSTSCQVFQPGSATATVAAAAATRGVVLTRDGQSIAFSEYSAENNAWDDPSDGLSCSNPDLSCGNGRNGSPRNGWPCLSDPVGTGRGCFGHGRGMSQWGTQRWAANHGRDWLWITNHYFNNSNQPGGMRNAFLANLATATTMLDNFENGVGRFGTGPTYSGSTVGISTASTAMRTCSVRHGGTCSLHVRLVDDPGSSAAWAVRLLSGVGTPAANAPLSRTGSVGFWVYAGGSGMSVAVGIDDSDGTERSVTRAIPANRWTYVSWPLADAGQWSAWAGGNGAISASNVKLDAIWLYHANTSYDINVYIDDVQVRN
ncbi:hypothetical protein H9645_12500 [Luteimonas sp. Sa2BVA3]|uniref:Sporulation stage II protein D amidase enhancer LytB N-terminal domain-containing protein n=1 Tax=Luteimonas colneyensis TaxID=2762230 RepID=A0ABR8ULE9_9GAMM|nr:SpoIID/LytB domain-containing protein [Luteimonas colneyensis]MBD7988850.1 hypothetical protein [Luteimonas colneyensis]